MMKTKMIRIDGTHGEGGGQVLRTALGLSVVTGTPFAIDNIRARRSKPGLKRQHLTAVLAAARVGSARVEGADLGSLAITFAPQTCSAGTYEFAIGTAGSTTLVLQTVLPALWAADGPSTVRLTGGTHNPMAPPYDFLKRTFAPVAHRMGASLELNLDRHGFFPAGGGELRARIAPAAWTPIELLDKPSPDEVTAQILISNLHARVGNRERDALRRELELRPDQVDIVDVDAAGPGNAIIVRVPLGVVEEVVTQFGERGVLAEHVAQRAAKQVKALQASTAPVGEHLADQLLIPMALAGAGAFRTVEPSLHTRTNAEIIERFLPVSFSFVEDEAAKSWVVEVKAR
ncbi:MAG: RNA 3'-terminal phosphate cyclase [Planctomycetota bacterium]